MKRIRVDSWDLLQLCGNYLYIWSIQEIRECGRTLCDLPPLDWIAHFVPSDPGCARQYQFQLRTTPEKVHSISDAFTNCNVAEYGLTHWFQLDYIGQRQWKALWTLPIAESGEPQHYQNNMLPWSQNQYFQLQNVMAECQSRASRGVFGRALCFLFSLYQRHVRVYSSTPQSSMPL